MDADREYAFPGIKGFNRRGLYRMKQFYETAEADLAVKFAKLEYEEIFEAVEEIKDIDIKRLSPYN